MTPIPAEQRGSLVVKERAVARVAVTAALTVPDVVRQVGGLPRLTGRELPRADVSVGEHSVAVNLYVAVTWPCLIPDVAAAVHDVVAQALSDIIGLPLYRMNVVVAHARTSADSLAAADTTAAAETGQDTETGQAPDGAGASTRPATNPTVRPRPPTSGPAAAFVVLIAACALLASAVVAGREVLVRHDWISGTPWIHTAIDWLGALQWNNWLLAVFGAAAVAGVALVVLGLMPRTRTHTGAVATTSSVPIVWLRPTDVARMCSDAVGALPSVESARTTVTPKRVKIDVRHVGGDPTIVEDVRTAVAPTLAVLADTRRVDVRVRRAES